MTLVLTPKFNYEEMLKSIVRYKITHLLYDSIVNFTVVNT